MGQKFTNILALWWLTENDFFCQKVLCTNFFFFLSSIGIPFSSKIRIQKNKNNDDQPKRQTNGKLLSSWVHLKIVLQFKHPVRLLVVTIVIIIQHIATSFATPTLADYGECWEITHIRYSTMKCCLFLRQHNFLIHTGTGTSRSVWW